MKLIGVMGIVFALTASASETSIDCYGKLGNSAIAGDEYKHKTFDVGSYGEATLVQNGKYSVLVTMAGKYAYFRLWDSERKIAVAGSAAPTGNPENGYSFGFWNSINPEIDTSINCSYVR